MGTTSMSVVVVNNPIEELRNVTPALELPCSPTQKVVRADRLQLQQWRWWRSKRSSRLPDLGGFSHSSIVPVVPIAIDEGIGVASSSMASNSSTGAVQEKPLTETGPPAGIQSCPRLWSWASTTRPRFLSTLLVYSYSYLVRWIKDSA